MHWSDAGQQEHQAEPLLDTVARLATPERIVFEYPLAGPFARFWAYVIDWMIWAAILVAVWLLGMFAGIGIGFALVLTFVVQWGFGAFCEAVFNGRTPGKMALGLRVVSEHGGPITPAQALIRNLLGPVDGWPFGFMLGLASVAMTERFQRLGDLAAGTMVVAVKRPRPAPLTPVRDREALALLKRLPAKLELDRDAVRAISDYVGRRSRLKKFRRREMTKTLADSLIQRYRLRPDLDPDALVCAVYARVVLGD